MPLSEMATPSQCSGAMRSRPISADTTATTIGVHPMISAPFDTLVAATPPTKRN